MVGAHVSYKGFVVRQSRMQQVAPSGRIRNQICCVMLFEQLIELIGYPGISKPIRMAKFYGQYSTKLATRSKYLGLKFPRS